MDCDFCEDIHDHFSEEAKEEEEDDEELMSDHRMEVGEECLAKCAMPAPVAIPAPAQAEASDTALKVTHLDVRLNIRTTR